MLPIVALLCVIGSYALKNSYLDIVIMMIFGVVGFILKEFGIKPAPIILGLIEDRNNYSRLTKEWRHDWQLLLKVIPSDVRVKAEEIAERWGLRCDWGCGFILKHQMTLKRQVHKLKL